MQEDIRQIIREELQSLIASDRYTFQKHVQVFDGRNIQLGKRTGTKIGTEATQKIGLYGKIPVVQASAITVPSGGTTTDTEARTAITSIINALKSIGITA